MLFLQETHPDFNDESAWADDFKIQVFIRMVYPGPEVC